MSPDNEAELTAAMTKVLERISEGRTKELVKAGFRSLLGELRADISNIAE